MLNFSEQLTQGWDALRRIAEMQYHYNPRELVYQHDKVKLYHYQPKCQKPHAIPVLVVFATVNRPEILDLFPEHSFVGGLLANGLDVYFLDWGYPDKADKMLSLTDYVTKYLHTCVTYLREKTKQEKIELIGVCQGGVICLSYAALYPHVKNLVLISTPIDFQTSDNTVYHFVKKMKVDDFVSLCGNIPGEWLTEFFITLRPFELIGKKYLRFIDNLADKAWTDKFLRVEKWLHDAPDQTGASFAEFIKDFYQGNKLVKGEIYLGGRRVDLKKLTMPVLNVMAAEDEIIPTSASKVLRGFVTESHYSEQVYPSGHIGIYVSEKVGGKMSEGIAKWVITQN